MTDYLAELQLGLAGRYVVDREIGRGGMASVFLARDLQNNRQVALKVLSPEIAAVAGDRFLREIATVGALSHPHILPIYDSGKTNGLAYFVMPFVEGESLGGRIARLGPLPLDEALTIAIDVAEALAFAHQRGIIHRDIKPDNILLAGNQAIVADFGIARAIVRAAGEVQTSTGIAVGTPQYMSPEQAAANQDIDGRSDIYALGCVLYEALTGEPPFDGPTVQSIVAKHVSHQPPSLTMLRPKWAMPSCGR